MNAFRLHSLISTLLLAFALSLSFAPLALGSQALYVNIDKFGERGPLLAQSYDTPSALSLEPFAIGYGSESGFDPENDGLESLIGVIDVQVLSHPSLGLDPSCVRWDLFSIPSASSQQACMGESSCCLAFGLEALNPSFTSPLYLAFGSFGLGESNIISAQLASLHEGNLLFSKWMSVDAFFFGHSSSSSADSLPPTSFDAMHLAANEMKVSNPLISEVSIRSSSHQDDASGLFTSASTLPPTDASNSLPDALTIHLHEPTLPNEPYAKHVSFTDTSLDASTIENLPELRLSTSDPSLESALRAHGIETLSLISIRHADTIFNPSGYRGEVSFYSPHAPDTLLYCPDDSLASCTSLAPCQSLNESCYHYFAHEMLAFAFVPHFSTIILAEGNESINVTIISPKNTTFSIPLTLNITSNLSITLNYSIDGTAPLSLGMGTSFFAQLNGTLSYGVLSNGAHTLALGILDQFGRNFTITHHFIVNDTQPPAISLNFTNQSSIGATYLYLPLNFTSDEPANLSVFLNAQPSLSLTLPLNRSAYAILQPTNGQNNLTITARDMNGNSKNTTYSFTFQESGTCSDALQNGQETGIDCGGSCGSCITFNASTDRPAYNQSDAMYITIISRAYSAVNVTISRAGIVTYRYEFKPAFSGIPIAETRAITNSSALGNYTLFAISHYYNTSQTLARTFEVTSPTPSSSLSASITANATTFRENSVILLIASISSNVSAVSYKWDIGNDQSIESTQPNYTWHVQTNGTFFVNLTVSDLYANATDIETFLSKKTHNVTVIARDNASTAALFGVNIEIGSDEKNTSSDGTAQFLLEQGSNEADVFHESYRPLNHEFDLLSALTLTLNLTPIDRSAPIVQLNSPANGSVLNERSFDVSYYVYDNRRVTCVTYLRPEGAILWRTAGSQSFDSPSGEARQRIEAQEGTQEWRVECRDIDGNSNTTGSYLLIVSDSEESMEALDLTESLLENDALISNLTARINIALTEVLGLSGTERDVSESMQLRKTLERANTNLQRAERDFHSLEWRRLNQSEFEAEKAAIRKRILDIEAKTPISFTVLESTEFVGYPRKEGVQQGLLAYLNFSGKEADKRTLAALLEENVAQQSQLTITTKAAALEVDYLNGERKKHTLIKKKIETKTIDFSGHVFYEIIPKSVARTINETQMLFEFELIDADPIVAIDLASIKEYAYLIDGSAPLKEMEGISSVLLSKDVRTTKKSPLTGFAFIDSVSSNLRETIDIRLVVEVIIIAILAIVYLVYSFGSIEQIKRRFEPKGVRDVRHLIDSLQADIAHSDYEHASLLYKDVSSAYAKLGPDHKQHLSSLVTSALADTNVLYIKKLLREADSALLKNDRDSMAISYAKIRALYKIIPKDHKAQVLERSMALHHALSKPQENVAAPKEQPPK